MGPLLAASPASLPGCWEVAGAEIGEKGQGLAGLQLRGRRIGPQAPVQPAGAEPGLGFLISGWV